MGVFGTLVEVCDSRKFPGCEFELRIQVHKGKGISANVVMQRAGHKCKNQHKAMHWFAHQSRLCFLLRTVFPFAIIKAC